jgi:carotenoid cleavage dioxygenase
MTSKVKGKIPDDLNGRFLRVGGNPNPVDPEDPRTYNWFIGSGMVFGVRLREGRAEWYRNRFVRDDRISATMRLPRVPGPDQLSRTEPYREKKGPRYVEANVTNTHVFAVNGRTYAFAEAGVLPMELSYELETVARSDFSGTLNGHGPGTRTATRSRASCTASRTSGSGTTPATRSSAPTGRSPSGSTCR